MIHEKVTHKSRKRSQMEFLMNEYTIAADEVNLELEDEQDKAKDTAVTRLLDEYSDEHEIARVNMTLSDVRRHNGEHSRRHIKHDQAEPAAEGVEDVVIVKLKDVVPSRERRSTPLEQVIHFYTFRASKINTHVSKVSPEVQSVISYTDHYDGSFTLMVGEVNMTSRFERNGRGQFTEIDALYPFDTEYISATRARLVAMYVQGESAIAVYQSWVNWRREYELEIVSKLTASPVPFDAYAIHLYVQEAIGGELNLPAGAVGETGTETVKASLSDKALITIIIVCAFVSG